jgi:23S rRNA (cytosine1962-C5)-methyltransferase
MKRIILKSGEEGRILQGHPWVYDNEAERVLDGKTAALLRPGDCADVESCRQEYLGRAIVNPHSKIIARIYSPSKEGMDKGFFKRRIREALRRRTPFADFSRDSVRIVFAEADFLPGLIIDLFTGWPVTEVTSTITRQPITFEAVQTALGPPKLWLAAQFLAWGMDSRREMIIDAMEDVLCAMQMAAAGIIEKSADRVRELEGLPHQEGLLRGEFPAGGFVIFENGFPFAVDPLEGQKTGHFLDQRGNRMLAGKFAAMLAARSAKDDGAQAPLRVLDACAYTGGFGIHVLRAAENAAVEAVDVSAAALEGLRRNAVLNGVAGRITAVEGDVFDILRKFERQKEKFDMVILDPPAFAKSRTQLGQAIRGYKEINLRAMKLLRRDGILITCSCSHALDEGRFKRMIAEAAADAERRLIQLDFRYQGPDHPVLVGYDESLYLKCGFYSCG